MTSRQLRRESRDYQPATAASLAISPTPIGALLHSDYPRLGLPLSIIVVLLAVPVLKLVWPLR